MYLEIVNESQKFNFPKFNQKKGHAIQRALYEFESKLVRDYIMP